MNILFFHYIKISYILKNFTDYSESGIKKWREFPEEYNKHCGDQKGVAKQYRNWLVIIIKYMFGH